MFMQLKLTALACATVAFGAAGIAHAAEADNSVSRSDTRFLERAAQSGKLEIDASKIAIERAQSQEVKDFAQKMITDHQAVDTELRTLAQSKKVELPTELRWGQNRTIKSLQDREGHEFDERYVDKVAVDAHEDAVDLFENAAENADDPQIKAFAAKVLPDLKNHLSMGEQLEKSLQDSRAKANNEANRSAPAGAVPPAPGTGTGAPAPTTTGGMGTTPDNPAAAAAGAAGTNR